MDMKETAYSPVVQVHQSVAPGAIESTCEFCLELDGAPDTRFHSIYGAKHDRIVARRNRIVAMPTLGQLFVGSLLILPDFHCETVAQLRPDERQDLLDLVNLMKERVRSFGFPLTVEHGARQGSGSGCGIYHAHFHLIPLPEHLHFGELLADAAKPVSSLDEALDAAADLPAYIVCQDTWGSVALADPFSSSPNLFASQYVRKRLAARFGLCEEWDWRSYHEPEAKLLETLSIFGANNVPLS